MQQQKWLHFICIENLEYSENKSKLTEHTYIHRLSNTNLRCETLYISSYEYVNICTFAGLDIKLLLQNGYINTDHPLYSFKFI